MQVQTGTQEQPYFQQPPLRFLLDGMGGETVLTLPGTQLHVQTAPGGMGEPQGRV
jgi:hypothetical protein